MTAAPKAKFVVYCAIDIPADHANHVLWRKGKLGLPEAYVPKLGEDIEVCQFALEVPTKPITLRKFQGLLADMSKALTEKAVAAGLVLA